ncbi:hypothetical protein [Sabulicella glaciei]|uniref:G domain-containing protein n=1 Tax=Sabulicella glaciei TaxID=2984948 RepID=A0ABT3P0Q6_9PROT|nr:hypothetical protein [Roseococcus sp. MDT2-1-1]MCW8087976.1 hypothetical protein [Roseococcus sp. MDT2-1-1]
MRIGLRRYLRRYWREALLGFCLAAPWLSLMVLGGLWLWEAGRVVWWAVGAALFALAAWPLRVAVRRRAIARVTQVAASRRGFDPTEDTAEDIAAREMVNRRAAEAGPLDLTDREAVERTLRETVEAVAAHYHPAAKRPALQITPPELLLLMERLSNRLRGLIRDFPLLHRTKLERLVSGAEFWDRHGGTLTRLYEAADALWRVSRFARNPASAVFREAARVADVSTFGLLTDTAGREAHRFLIREAGDAAIALYSGRLRMTEAEINAITEPVPEAAPLRLAITGRPGAGVTTLAAALETAAREAGFALLERGAWRGADAVLLVSPAMRPDRAEDLALLEALRKEAGLAPPPILVAMTGADLLPPPNQWPPESHPAKRATLDKARAAVAEALDVADVHPVAFPPNGTPWGLEALAAALVAAKSAARRAREARLRAEDARFSPLAEAGRAFRTGRSVLSALSKRK